MDFALMGDLEIAFQLRRGAVQFSPCAENPGS
jgi:hypothetical protein